MENRAYYKFTSFCIIGVIIFGLGSSQITKLLNNQDYFYYPLFQTFLMFLGEFSNIFVLILSRFFFKKKMFEEINSLHKQSEKKTGFQRIEKLTFCLCGLLDFVASFIQYISFYSLEVNIYVSLKIMPIVYIVIYLNFFKKRTIYKHQVLGLIVFSIGMLLIIFDLLFNNDNQTVDFGSLIYIGLMMLSGLFEALNFLTIEHLVWKIKISPEEVNTITGITGLSLCCLCCSINYIFGVSFKTIEFEKPWRDLFSSSLNGVLVFFIIIDLCFYNYFVVATIKISDTLAYCTINSGRIPVSIVIGFFYPGTINAYQIVGGFFIVLGLLIYNAVIVVPFFGLKKAAKLSIEENKVMRELRQKKRSLINRFEIFLNEVSCK
jgi:drug/metabolite transporter (DMT)-like permease